MASDGMTLTGFGGGKLIRWVHQVRLAGKLTIALALAALASGITTYAALSLSPVANPETVRVLLLLDLVLLLLLIAVIARQLVSLWVERRRGSAGSRLHGRIVALFSVVAIGPAIVMAAFSLLFFNLGLQTWFSTRVSTAVAESVAVAEAYIAEHSKVIEADVLAMAADLNRDARRLARNPTLFNQIIATQARFRSLSEAVVFDSSGQVLARSALSFVMEFERVPIAALDKAGQGQVAVIKSDSDDRVRALIRLEGFLDAYLFVGRFVDPRVVDHYERALEAAKQYKDIEATRSRFEVTSTALFSVVALLMLLVAIWFGLLIATRLVRPIGGMVAAAERIREGDFSVRVDEGAADDEMSILGRAFNRMTGELDAQRRELIEANRQLDDRRRFTETVLAGVSAGVIGVGRDGRVTLVNPSAVELLAAPADRLIGIPFVIAVPEMGGVFAPVNSGGRQAQRQVTLTRSGKTRNLLVRVARETSRNDPVGFVVTFDDITDLVEAQRTAAWADVARRIAHEIKNPLTPIQLSAERLKRKYLGEIATDPDVFAKCTDTIIRQVGDIGRMVDEFSAFARLPAPTYKQENLGELIRQSIFLQQVAHGDIDYVNESSEKDLVLRCDGRQVAQVLTNVLQNAADAIDGRLSRGNAVGARGRIVVRASHVAGGGIVVEVRDNGRGLPLDHRQRLTEPYVTTRTKGTGLGLAIVRKIMEEHGGELDLDDALPGTPEAGACIRLVFPANPDPATKLGVDQGSRDHDSGREARDHSTPSPSRVGKVRHGA